MPVIKKNTKESGFMGKFLGSYKKFFSIVEIEKSKILQWFFIFIIFIFFVAFFSWSRSTSLTKEAVDAITHTCWPYFQSCGNLYFLSALPVGYSYSALYMLFFALLIFSVYFVWKQKFIFAHMIMSLLFVWKFLVLFVLSNSFIGNYYYYSIILSFVFLFLPLKLFFLRLVMVVMYFLASTVKIHDGWILGTYFSSLVTGMPIFHDFTIPFFTNFVIIMEMVGSWFLLSSNRYLQKLVFIYFVIFHLYSGIIVLYLYPTVLMPALIILFGPRIAKFKVPLNKKAIPGFIFIAFLILLQLVSFMIPGDEKLTLEGNYYGFYMFEANHQCVSNSSFYYKNGTLISNQKSEVINARNRCDPYRQFFRFKHICKRFPDEIGRVEWSFDHSINGNPFYRIVDVKDACRLEYSAFRHNVWIKFPDEAEIIGYPVKNIYE